LNEDKKHTAPRDAGLIWGVTVGSGKAVSEYELLSCPVWDGIAAAGG
jgi:hypothetical protein